MSEINDRLTVVETVYHRSVGENPTSFESRYSRELKTREQPYVRRLTATEEWQPLNLGWIERPGLIVIRNEEGSFTQFNPTPEERAEAEAKVLELRYVGSLEHEYWGIPPRESMRGSPKSTDLLIRCQRGQARFTVAAFPE